MRCIADKSTELLMVKTFISLVVVIVLSGCSAPGAPHVRTDMNDSEGIIISGCQNVSLKVVVPRYQTGAYMSTWGSAWREGAQSGVQSGLETKDGDRSRVRFTKKVSSSVMNRMLGSDGSDLPFLPFCMHFDAPSERVKKAVAKILPHIQNPLVRGLERFGNFETDFFEREHTAAKWRDRYLVDVRQVKTGSDVYVYRDLWISRQGDPFVRAESNGGNEAWILQNIRLLLR